ncbi:MULTISPECIES: thioredoxin family protein [unclassified Polaribacter]|uniref:thioredoxin family protein n=1 Tax=unclassified Polaribacter TaxID=196858 RepID=UPI0011BDE2D2|nr:MULTISPECIES: thioredoxin family protein [unclassified Polaribacter]TXD52822.1 thioredoxin family protein [Polaribacter sp. IC063]TXD61699.1 thioredoxin family protein [Polaribacter sp. IC066]
MKDRIKKSLENTYTYQEYKDLVRELLAEGKSTGPNQSEDITNYSMLNDKRMKRLDKTIKITAETVSEIQNLKEPQTWLVLTEGWCGDAAQNLPVIHKMAELNENIELKLILRDENLELMDLFLTNGGRSIPKLLVLDKEHNVSNTWGPRPAEASKLVHAYKAKHGVLDAQLKEDLQVWYNKDKGKSTQDDFIKLVSSTATKEV